MIVYGSGLFHSLHKRYIARVDQEILKKKQKQQEFQIGKLRLHFHFHFGVKKIFRLNPKLKQWYFFTEEEQEYSKRERQVNMLFI